MTTSSNLPAENPNIYNAMNINSEEDDDGDRRKSMRELLEAYLREHAPSRLSDLNTLAEHPRFNNANINSNNKNINKHEMEKVYARLNKMYARERTTTARQRRRMTAFYEQYAPSEVGKIQPLLERGWGEEAVFSALYRKYGVPAEGELYSSAAQEHRRREITAFLTKHHALTEEEEKEKEEKEMLTAMEAAMNMDGPVDVVLQQLDERYKKSAENTSSSVSHTVTEPQPQQQQSFQQESSQEKQKTKERHGGDGNTALRRRLTAFYAIHCPNKLEEKVSYAMSLKVDEDVLFASLHRRYNLDADGNPLLSTVSSARSRGRRSVDELSCASSSVATTITTGTNATTTTTTTVTTTARGTTMAVLTPEKEQLRQRLVAFYEKHNPVNIDAKVQRALSLNVEEEELFCALYRQYHLDESGEPIVKKTDTLALSVEDDNHDKITTMDVTWREEQISIDNPTGGKQEEDEEEEYNAIIENDRVLIKDEITYENDKIPLKDSVKTLSRHERLQEFFQEFDEESREMLQQQYIDSEMSDDELMEYLYKLKERGEIMPSVEAKEVLQHLPPSLFAFEEELEQITAFEMVSEVQIPTEVQKPRTTTMMLSASHSDVCGNSPVTLFSRHTRWFAGSGWKDVERDQVRSALLSDLAASADWFCSKDMDAVVVAQQQQQNQQDGMQVTFFISCKDSISAETNEEMVKSAVFHSAQQLLLDQMLTPQQKEHNSNNNGEEASCVVVRCLFPRMRSSVLRHASDTQRALFVRALEVDLLAHAAQSGASHLTLGSRMSVHGRKGLELRCEMYFPSDAQAGEYVMLLLSDNAVYCREARRTYALLGGDAHEVAVAVVTPIPTSMAVGDNNNNSNIATAAARSGSGGGGGDDDVVLDGDVWSIANRKAALEYRESQLLAREKELQSRLMLLEQRERVVRRLIVRDAESTIDLTTSNNSAEDRAMRLASEVRARLKGH